MRTNLLLLLHALPPLAIAAPVVALIAVHLNDFFRLTPLQTGGAAVLTVRLRAGQDASEPVSLRVSSWIAVDAPPVHVPSAREISWRLRASARKLGVCEIAAAGETVTQPLNSRPWPGYSGGSRLARGLNQAGLKEAGPIEAVWISESPAPLDWELWFAVVASLTAWLLPRLFQLLSRRL